MAPKRSVLSEVLEPHEREIETQLQTKRGTQESIADFIPRISPKFSRPLHLQPLLDVLEEIRAGKQRFVLLSVPPRHSKCQPAGAPVLLTDGRSIAIETVHPGDEVVTLGPNFRLTSSFVDGISPNGVKPVFRVTTLSGRTIDGTSNHPLLTQGGWSEIDFLRVGELIAVTRESDADSAAQSIRLVTEDAVIDISWDQIVSIDYIGELPTYAISVCGTKNYVSGGVVSHNSETLLHAIPWLLLAHPDWTIAYASYSAKLALFQSSKARNYARLAGVEFSKETDSKGEWRTAQRGGVIAAGVGGAFTGFGANCFFVDDPHKDRASAESAVKREAIGEWFQSAAITRIEPGGSCIVCHTRWAESDLIGLQIKSGDADWQVISLPAIAEDDDDASGRRIGSALWPERWPVPVLEKIKSKVGPYEWASLYQCRPRPKGGSVFNNVSLYRSDELPASGYKIAIGCDLAYSAKTSSDYACAVVMMLHNGLYYVLEVVRMHASTPVFRGELRKLRKKYPSARIGGYVASVEVGSIDLMNAKDDESSFGERADSRSLGRYNGPSLNFEVDVTRADKFSRAQPTAAAWNGGRIMLPNPCVSPEGDRYGIEDEETAMLGFEWIDPFQKEVLAFTGINDPHDDQVDAMCWAYDALGGADFTVEVSGARTSYDKFAGSSMTKSSQSGSGEGLNPAFLPNAPDGWMPAEFEAMYGEGARKGRGF